MIYLYLPFALLLIYFSLRSFRGGIAYRNYFKEQLNKSKPGFSPFVTVIAPCKGVDDGLAANFEAVIGQNYDDFEVLFVVDDESDSAVNVIQEIVRTAEKQAKLIVAPKAVDCSQKVENLRESVSHADDRSEVFVFVDSDVRPGRDWLGRLVSPLEDGEVGAATGYRWFVSEKTNLSTEMRSSWNASIASALGPDPTSNFCWGGSTAIRRDVFERLDIREKWRGTLSDDFALTRALNAAALPIVFVPQALVPSAGRCSWRELFEFTNRQMKITRVYAPKLWLMSFFGSGLFNVVMFASVILLLFSATGSFAWVAALVTLLFVGFFSIGKAWLRLNAVRMALPREITALRRQFPFQILFWLFTPQVFLINSIAALLSRKIAWRGTEYLMISSEETRVL